MEPTKRKISQENEQTSKKLAKYDLKLKLDIIELAEKGTRVSHIANQFDMPWSTIKDIINKKDKYKSLSMCGGDIKIEEITNEDVQFQLESKLIQYYNDNCQEIDVYPPIFYNKALEIFTNLKKDYSFSNIDFNVNVNWFNDFCSKKGLHHLDSNVNSHSLIADSSKKTNSCQLNESNHISEIVRKCNGTKNTSKAKKHCTPQTKIPNENSQANDTLDSDNEIAEQVQIILSENTLTLDVLKEAESAANALKNILLYNDAERSRSIKACALINKGMQPYLYLLKEMKLKQEKQLKFHSFY